MFRKLILICLLMGSLCASAQTPQQWRDSVSVLMEQIRLHPNSIDLRLRKAEANINLLQWDYALEEYGRVLRMDSRNLAALYFRAYCYGKQHHYDLAKADYEAFLTIQPQHLEAHIGLAHVLQKMERKTDTMDELNRIVQLPTRQNSGNTMWPFTIGMRPSNGIQATFRSQCRRSMC